MTKKKKKKIKSLKKETPLFKVAYPLGKSKNKPFMIKIGGIWLDPGRMIKAINVLHKEIAPGKATHINKKLTEFYISKKLNWFSLIMLAETVGLTPDRLFTIIRGYFQKEKISKFRVGLMNPTMVKLLLKKIDSWGGVPKAWSNHKSYIDSWCKKTGTPVFKSLSNFQDHLTAWKDVTVGKRKWKKIGGYSAKGDKEFSIFNPP